MPWMRRPSGRNFLRPPSISPQLPRPVCPTIGNRFRNLRKRARLLLAHRRKDRVHRNSPAGIAGSSALHWPLVAVRAVVRDSPSRTLISLPRGASHRRGSADRAAEPHGPETWDGGGARPRPALPPEASKKSQSKMPQISFPAPVCYWGECNVIFGPAQALTNQAQEASMSKAASPQ